MTNSDQDNKEPRPEVEDPITNPGKREVNPEPSVGSTTAPEPQIPLSNSNTHWLLIGGAVVLVAVLYMFMSGGPGEGGTPNTDQTANSDQSQETGAASDNLGNQTGGESTEGAGEGGLPVVEDTTPATNSEGAGNEDRVLDSIDLQTDIAVSNNEELLDEVTDMLVLSDRLGPNDELSISAEGEANGNRIIRMEQTHLGIPVFGAGVVAVESNGTVINISGSTGNDIEISVEPGLTYEEALAIATSSLTESVIEPRDQTEAQLFIVDVEGTYHLAWYSSWVAEGSQERILLDANDGEILLRRPLLIGEV